MPSPEVQEYAENVVKKLYDSNAKVEHATQLFAEVESSKFTAEEKQEIYQHVASEVGKREMPKEGMDPNTFLRANTAPTRFTAEYMKQYATEYNEAVTDIAFDELSRVKIPDDSGYKDHGLPKAGTPENDGRWKPETIKALNDEYLRVATNLVRATETQIGKVSPQAQKFLQSLMKPALDANKPESVNIALSSTLLLRGAVPNFIGSGGVLKNTVVVRDPELHKKGDFMANVSGVLQSYANGVNQEIGFQPKQQAALFAAQIRTEGNVNQTRSVYNALAKGGDTFKSKVGELDLSEQRALDVPKPKVDGPSGKELKELSEGALERLQAKQAQDVNRVKAAPQLEQIAKLEKKIDALKKPWNSSFESFKEHVKAAFSGGKNKAVEDTVNTVDKLKEEAFRIIDEKGSNQLQKQNQKSVEQLTAEREQAEVGDLRYRHAESQVKSIDQTMVLDDRLTASGINAEPLSQEYRETLGAQREVALGEMRVNKTDHVSHQQHDKEISGLQKNVSVREKLGKKPEGQEVPKQTKGLKV